MKSLSVLALAAGCAGAGTTPFAMTERAAAPELVLSTEPAARRSFPERLSPARLPSADRASIADDLSARIELCVAPDGAVQSVSVEQPSASPAFDRALAADIPGWRFAPYRAPAGLKVCEEFTVAYLAR